MTLDQHGCLCIPHVIGIMAGQNMEVISSDQTVHTPSLDAGDGEHVSHPFYAVTGKGGYVRDQGIAPRAVRDRGAA